MNDLKYHSSRGSLKYATECTELRRRRIHEVESLVKRSNRDNKTKLGSTPPKLLSDTFQKVGSRMAINTPLLPIKISFGYSVIWRGTPELQVEDITADLDDS
ncbi:hypothetical protein WA026_015489 [Henosepilachna vigintioctopunctata]|uniref:Uncharacterized protein n=1 Tax=Henosepilachna vigintioctopunctata TaxID=420089 RepID=A0AAW1UKM6_9CUCU